MAPPALEIADLIRTAGAAFVERSHQWIRWRHVKVLLAIARCRTAALGGHLDECTRCAHRTAISYNSCRDRHCPKFYKKGSQEKNLPLRLEFFLLRSPHERAGCVLTSRTVCSVAGTLGPSD